MSTSVSVIGLFVIVGVVILAGTILVGGAVMLVKSLRRPPTKTDGPTAGDSSDSVEKSKAR